MRQLLFFILAISLGFMAWAGAAWAEVNKNFQPPQLEPRYYYLKLSYDQEKGEFAKKTLFVRLGETTSSSEKKDFVAQLFSLENELLETVYFAPVEQDLVVKIPYHYNGKTIKIFSVQNLKQAKAEFSVQAFAKVCGNGICEAHESYENCTQDCPSGGADDYCDHQKDGICDPDCHNWQEVDPDCAKHKPKTVSYSDQSVSQQNQFNQPAKQKSLFFSNKTSAAKRSPPLAIFSKSAVAYLL